LRTEFAGEYVAAVRDVGVSEQVRGDAPLFFKGRNLGWRRYVERVLKTDPDQAETIMNAGLLLFNIPAFSADGFSVYRNIGRHIRYGYALLDQCILNRLLRGKIKYLHPRWNLQLQRWGEPRLVEWFSEQVQEAHEDPAVLHYLTRYKPWRALDVTKEDVFWKTAARTEWFCELYARRLTRSFLPWLNGAEPESCSECFEQPLFSIIMPVYNRKDEVVGSLKSILLQRFRNFEILVVDDASTDGTVDVVEQLSQKDSRIRLIRLETNGGPGPARNAGTRAARGTYIRFCDSDDFYPPAALEVLARCVERDPADVVAGNQAHWFSQRDVVEIGHGYVAINRAVRAARLRDVPELWSLKNFHRCAFRREFLLANRIEFPALVRGEDPSFLAVAYTRAASFALIQEPVYLFHARPRNHYFEYEELRDAYAAHDVVFETLKDAGYADIAGMFTLFHSPFVLDHRGVSATESLELSERLIRIARRVPLGLLSDPDVEKSGLDRIGLQHDLIIASHADPETVSELIARKMFCGLARFRREEQKELSQARRERSQLRPLIRLLRLVRKVPVKIQSKCRQSLNAYKRAVQRRQRARYNDWKAEGKEQVKEWLEK